eukprot:scaffold577627_cov17-Prasinocladus_malaysianus.AAC.1
MSAVCKAGSYAGQGIGGSIQPLKKARIIYPNPNKYPILRGLASACYLSLKLCIKCPFSHHGRYSQQFRPNLTNCCQP